MITPILSRNQIAEFYDAYYEVLDSVDLDAWPEFFAEDCVYRIISRENYERGFRLATVGAESRGMLKDRVTGLIKTQVFAPRYYRRFPGPLNIKTGQAAEMYVQHNLLMVQTMIDKPTEIVFSARCHDTLVSVEGRPLLKRRDVVFDSEMVPNSLIYPA